MKKVKRRLGCSPALKTVEKCDQEPKMRPNLEQVFPPPSQRLFAEEINPSARQRVLVAINIPHDENIVKVEKDKLSKYLDLAHEGAKTQDAFQNPFFENKSHRCTYYRPSIEDFGQLTDGPPVDYYQNLLQEICCDPNQSGTTRPEMKNACQGSTIQTCSQFVEPASLLKLDEIKMADALDDSQWQTLDSVSDVDMFLANPGHIGTRTAKKCTPSSQSTPSHIRISETPRVRRIAEKFSKYKKNNVELRRLDERVVCLEYDIFDADAPASAGPRQKMRAFFSIKTKEDDGNDKENISLIPSGVKRDFNIEDGDLQKLNKKEIEIIDGEIPENRSLLEDLKRVLRRKQAIRHKKRQQTLDLMCLYEMAKRECPPVHHDYSNTNLLSKAELQEIKDLILKKCDSSVHGINRKTIQYPKGDIKDDTKCVISDSLMWELMQEPEKVPVKPSDYCN